MSDDPPVEPAAPVEPERFVPPVFLQTPRVSPLITVSGQERTRCPVCGDATGDCGDPDYVLDHMVELLPPAKADPAATFIVQDRVFIEQTVGRRTYRKLLYAVGDRIRPEEAKRVGLIP